MHINKCQTLDEVLKYGQLGELVITSEAGFQKLEGLLESYYDEKESADEAYERGFNDAHKTHNREV